MARKLKHAYPINGAWLRRSGHYLKSALFYAKYADCPALTKKIRSAIKSHGGATRHMEHRINRSV